jgi:hypothetical protein
VSRAAMARPIPRVPPVTSACRPSTPKIIRVSSLGKFSLVDPQRLILSFK